MAGSSLRTSAGQNRRQRQPLAAEQQTRAQDFISRVLAGAARIINRDASPSPLIADSGAQIYGTATIVDENLEYTVIVWATRRRDALNPDLLP